MFEAQLFNLSQHAISVLRASNEMDSTLLITGSTGTGKSHMAYAVHRASPKRSGGRWFKVNLATLSENLIESELFGHERGAFTGADAKRVGRLEICNGGTVFLDEIGELPLRLQAKLLDFIQYKKISPVGSNREIHLDVRIVAATNRNLESAVRAGEFRADLYHRLNVFHIRLPDLSLNPRACVQLGREFLVERAKQASKNIFSLSKEVEQIFRHYAWPGNVRELENAIEFAVAMETSQELRVSSLPEHLQDHAKEKMKNVKIDEPIDDAPVSNEKFKVIKAMGLTPSRAVACLELPITLDFHESKAAFESAYLEQVLKLCGGQINLTSRRIGLNKVSLTDKLKRHSIDWRKIRYRALGSSVGSVKAKATEEMISSA